MCIFDPDCRCGNRNERQDYRPFGCGRSPAPLPPHTVVTVRTRNNDRPHRARRSNRTRRTDRRNGSDRSHRSHRTHGSDRRNGSGRSYRSHRTHGSNRRYGSGRSHRPHRTCRNGYAGSQRSRCDRNHHRNAVQSAAYQSDRRRTYEFLISPDRQSAQRSQTEEAVAFAAAFSIGPRTRRKRIRGKITRR